MTDERRPRARRRWKPAAAPPPPGPLDHYRLLGVATNASTAEIRRAWLKLIKRHHPDIAGDRAEADAAIRLNQAYRCLSDPRTRAAYDRSFGHSHPVIWRAAPIAYEGPSRRRGLAVAALSLIALVGCYALYVRSPARAPTAGAQPKSHSDQQRRDITRASVIREAGLNFEWMALQSGAGSAQSYSAQCWDNVATDATDEMLDYCLAFDTIAQRTFGSANPYFGRAALIRRATASAGQLVSLQSIPARLARVTSILARDRTGVRAAQPADWFPLAGEIGGAPDASGLAAPRFRRGAWSPGSGPVPHGSVR